MRSKIILFTLIVFTSTSFATWFVGLGGGANINRKTGVGDLPMAREEFGVNHNKDSVQAKATIIMTDIMNKGGSFNDSLAGIKHLMSMELIFKPGWDIKVYGGYKLKNVDIDVGLSWQYIDYSYKYIRKINDNSEKISIFWTGNNMSGKTGLNVLLSFAEYNIRQLSFSVFTPVIGCGLGFARVQDKLTYDGKTKKREQTVFAYQIKLGLNYGFTENLRTTLEAVFFATSEVKATNNKIKQGQFNLGVRYLFN